MYIKVYFGDKPLFLTDSIDEHIQPYVHHDDAVFIDELDTHMIKTIIHEMQEPQVHSGVFFNPDLEILFKAFKKKFTVIQAAGGLVTNEKEQLLMIFRRGFWDLPKGKLYKGEKLESCALREVKEETGLEEVQLVSPLTTTYHTYHEGTKFILKESNWFEMKAGSNQKLTPQLEEGIQEIKWVERNDVDAYLSKAYSMITDIIDVYKG